jgi:uncharacterized damage-inducible protein DinB
MQNSITATAPATDVILSREELLNHWRGHRLLTRRVIEAFPEKELFSFSIGGMRPFAELAMEMIAMAGPGIEGLATDVWKRFEEAEPKVPATKEEVLQLWDAATERIDTAWPQIPEGRFQDNLKAFGQWEGTGWGILFYYIDNEIHHRGQGYVYLRALGIEPPAFWDR